VLERVRQLGPEAESVLQAAAVLTEPSREATLMQVTGLHSEQARSGLATAIASGLLHKGGHQMVSFRHVLAARAVYEAIPASVRHVLHERAGRALEALEPKPYPQVAHHMREVGNTMAWCKYGERAADLALVSGDESSAAVLLYDLLTAADLAADTVARLVGKFPILSFAGARRHERLISALRNTVSSAELTPQIEAEIRFHLGRVLLSNNENGAACAEFEQAIPGLAHDPAACVRAMTLLANRGGATLSASDRLGWLRRAAAVPVPSMTTSVRLRAAIDRIDVMLGLGVEEGWSEAAQIPDTSEAAEERALIARAALNVGDAAVNWGKYAIAGERLARASDLAERYGLVSMSDGILVTQAHLDWFTGRWGGLAERVVALEGNEDLPPLARGEALTVMGSLHVAKGDHARADDCLTRAIEGAQQRSAIEYLFEPSAVLATVRLSQHRVDDAMRITEEPAALLVNQAMWVYATDIVPARVGALIAADRLDDAKDLVAAFERGMRDRCVPAAKAALTQCHAVLAEKRGEYGDATRMFATVAAMWRDLPRPYAAALACERQAACLIVTGAPQDGVAVLRHTFDELTALGATRDVDRVAHALRGHGVVVPHARRGRRSYGDQLSPRELDVVRLVATGQTNRDIAKALSRSTATVATQLQSAMRKLGVTSRAAVAVRATEAGLIGNADAHASE
jgi:DNA-binding CsgD family transcriptional regulator/tetratricopeptide (TPR) repeat protein